MFLGKTDYLTLLRCSALLRYKDGGPILVIQDNNKYARVVWCNLSFLLRPLS
nr:MAG TPA: hypothetical protein [Caudoviricetes sp.]